MTAPSQPAAPAKGAHTKGPWEVSVNADGDLWMVGGPDDAEGFSEVVCEAYTRADADLIAAAPDLLEALRQISHTATASTCRDIARAALAKAGER